VKSWALRFRRPSGRTAKLTLGRWDQTEKEPEAAPKIGDPLTLASARALVSDLKRKLARGEDVAATRHLEKLERAARGEKTFAAAARDFVEQHAMQETRTWQERARLIGLRAAADGGLELIPKGLAYRWRDRPIEDIKSAEVKDFVKEVRKTGVPGLERRAGPSASRALVMFATLSKLFNWLVEDERLWASPLLGVARPKTLAARERALTSGEIAQFWKAAGAERKEVAAVLKLLLLTGQRLGEVRGMRRSELSADCSVWTIPPERTKNKHKHVVPLPPAARELIDSAAGDGALVFTTDGEHAIAVGSKIKRRLDAAMGVPPWRIHDLRRTCATGMADLGVAPHHVEAVLNHISGSKSGVAGVYNKAQYPAEKKAALERWARFVGLLVDPGLRAAHEKFLAGGDDGARAFAAAVAEGGERWARYLATIASGGGANVVALPPRKRR
jgi:integrase